MLQTNKLAMYKEPERQESDMRMLRRRKKFLCE